MMTSEFLFYSKVNCCRIKIATSYVVFGRAVMSWRLDLNMD